MQLTFDNQVEMDINIKFVQLLSYNYKINPFFPTNLIEIKIEL